jgi:hypothetical protein
MRKAVEATMTQTCIIARTARQSNNAGGVTSGISSTQTGIRCNMSASTMPQTRQIGGLEVTENTYKIKLPLGTDVQTGDRITVGSSVYQVIGPIDGSPKLCERVQCIKTNP